jgi:alpha-ketoglutarate-dependent taurine dioxygenase
MKNTLIALGILSILSCQTTQSTAAQESNGRTVENSAVRTSTTPRTETKNAPAGIPVAHNKEFVQNYLNETYRNLANAVQGLSKEQLNFKTAPDRWSILECVEHITVTQPELFGYVAQTLKQAPNPEKRADIKSTDDDIMTMMVNRTYKAQAPAEMQPSGKYKDVQSALDALQKNQKNMMGELNSFSMDDLRNRVMEAPIGSIDAYQFMLFIPGHTARHTLQILEVKEHPDFPKK